MGCDYYIQTELVIKFKDKNGKICHIYTNRELKNGYVFNYQDQDSDDDHDTANKKFIAEIERKIKDNTYKKMLFENDQWIKESYKLHYENYLMQTYKEITKIIKVYKNHSAWKRM